MILPDGENRPGSLHAAAHPLAAPSFQPAIGLETMDRREDRGPSTPRPWNEPAAMRRPPSFYTRGLPDLVPQAVERPEATEAPPAEPHFSFRWPEDEKVEPEKEAPERFMDLYLNLVMGPDRHRIQQSVGNRPYGGNESLVAFPDREQPVNVRDREVTERRLDSRGHLLFVRPAEKSLIELDLYRDARLSIEGFKTDVLGRDTSNGTDGGHFTARFRRGPLDDALEICYMRSGWRVGTTGDAVRVSYDREVLRMLHLELGSRVRYGAEGDISAGAHYGVSRDTTLNIVGGNSFDSTSIPTLYGLTNPNEQASWGTAFYVEIRF